MRTTTVSPVACLLTSGERRMCIRLMGILILLSVSVSCTKQEERQQEEKIEVIQTIHLFQNGDVTLDGRPVEIDDLATALSDTSPVRITADGKATTDYQIRVISECYKAGVRNAVMDYGDGTVLPIDFGVAGGREK